MVRETRADLHAVRQVRGRLVDDADLVIGKRLAAADHLHRIRNPPRLGDSVAAQRLPADPIMTGGRPDCGIATATAFSARP